MLIRSLVEWTSNMSGPKETESIPGILLLMMPHSRPAWMAVISGFFPVYSSYAFAQNPVNAESGFGVHAGYAPTKVVFAPARVKTDANLRAISSRAESTEERWLLVTWKASSSSRRMARLDEVSTMPGILRLMAS